MATRPRPPSDRTQYGLRLNKKLMQELKHLAVDKEQWLNDLIEEAIQDLLKKYKAKGK